jgi:hypothetical protein
MSHPTAETPIDRPRPPASRRALEAGLVLILALLPLLFFWRLITPNPADQLTIAQGDFTEQYFPLRAFTAREWVRGHLPLWNPYLSGGQPALADIQAGALYPPHIAQALLLGWGGSLLGFDSGFPLKALEWQVILHFSLAAVGTYLFARHLLRHTGFIRREARFGGVIASLVFTYGGYLTGFPVQQITILQVSAWLPWLLWGLDAALRQRKPAPLVGSILVLAMALLAGHPQTVLYLVYLSLAYSLFLALLLVDAPFSRRSWGQLARLLSIWLMVLAGGLGLAAAQLLPTLEFIRHSVRADMSFQTVSAGLPLTELVSILYPGFFGGSPEYVGIVTLGVMALALTLGWQHPQRHTGRWLVFWGVVGLFSLLLAFGGNLFVYPVLYLFAPGFDIVRQQERAFLLYSFSAAIVAGFGAAILVSSLPEVARQRYCQLEHNIRIVIMLLFFITGLFLFGAATATARGDEVNLFYGVLWHHLFGLVMLGGLAVYLQFRPYLLHGWGMALLAGWLAFNLFTVNWRFNLAPANEPPPFTPNGVVSFLVDAAGPQAPEGRVVSGGLLPGGNSAASVAEVQDLTGNTPLQLASMADFLARMPAWRLWQLLNVRYVVSARDIGDGGLTPVFAEDEQTVYAMGDPFERAWLVSSVEVVADERQAIARLAADDFDLRTQAIVPESLSEGLEAGDGPSSVAVKKIDPTHLALAVHASGRQLLVISQVFYPGWRVKVDGFPVPLRQVNGVLQGVVLSGGDHQVELYFVPQSFIIGLLFSVITLGLCGAGLLVPFVRRR